MAYFLNFRIRGVGGPVIDPYLLTGNGATTPPSVSVVPWGQVTSLLAGKSVVFVTHGFNVSYEDGANALEQLAAYLNLPPSYQFIGMLWPGDAAIPYIDYPFEGGPAMDSGAKLAAFCNRWCAGAQSLSFVSHSLGARMVLQAITGLNRRVRFLCMMAGAINRDCLTTEYAIAAAKCDRIAVLASHHDDVLKIAFPVGDLIADLLHGDHTPQSALGYNGPPVPAAVQLPWQIADGCDYGHGDYLPTAGKTKWQRPANFVSSNILGQPVVWPA
jgi:hypothetical protein